MLEDKCKLWLKNFLIWQDGRPSDTNRHLVYTAVEIFISDFDDQGAKFDQYNYHASIEEGMHNVSVCFCFTVSLDFLMIANPW